MEKIFNIQERTLRFGIRIVKFMDLLPKTTTCLILGKQLIRAATSIGANLEEADAAVSRRDFINKVGISMKEAYEARYWLRLIKGVGIVG
ncbi:MAG: four helix bundle protein, partial [Candidatus Margulisiibacteriota bacterium]